MERVKRIILLFVLTVLCLISFEKNVYACPGSEGDPVSYIDPTVTVWVYGPWYNSAAFIVDGQDGDNIPSGWCSPSMTLYFGDGNTTNYGDWVWHEYSDPWPAQSQTYYAWASFRDDECSMAYSEAIPVTVTAPPRTFTIYTSVNNASYGYISPGGDVTVNRGENITLTAIPNPGYSVDRWGVFVDGSSLYDTETSYTFDYVNSNHTFSANFSPIQYTLTTTPSPSNGSISGGGTYNYGSSATVTASPASGYVFTNWSGDASGSTNPLIVTMNGNKSITANFSLIQYTLSTSSSPSNGGSISGGGTYNYGSSATVTASPANGYIFTSWSGDAAGSTNPLTVPMNGNKNITANFAQIPIQYTLTISANNGTVSKSPDQTNYNSGSNVTLTATPASGYTFTSWSGDAAGSTNSLTVTMNGNKNITANFAPIPIQYTLTISATNGTVSKSPDQANYNFGSNVTLTPTPASGYTFTNWSGDASGSANPLTVTMNSNKNITANFAQQLPKSGTVEWNNLPIELRRVACNIPETDLASLSTDELLRKCLDYQFMSDILFTYEFKGGLDAISESFNGLRELFKRNDAATTIINYYNKIDPAKIDSINLSIEKGKFIFNFVFLELYLTQPVILKQLQGNEKIVIKEVLKKANSCIDIDKAKDKYVYSMFPLKVKGLLIAVLLDNMKDKSVSDLTASYPEYTNVIARLSISNISERLFSDLLKRASEL